MKDRSGRNVEREEGGLLLLELAFPADLKIEDFRSKREQSAAILKILPEAGGWGTGTPSTAARP